MYVMYALFKLQQTHHIRARPSHLSFNYERHPSILVCECVKTDAIRLAFARDPNS